MLALEGYKKDNDFRVSGDLVAFRVARLKEWSKYTTLPREVQKKNAGQLVTGSGWA